MVESPTAVLSSGASSPASSPTTSPKQLKRKVSAKFANIRGLLSAQLGESSDSTAQPNSPTEKADSPPLDKYTSMLQMGTPREAVLQKMALDGIDATLLPEEVETVEEPNTGVPEPLVIDTSHSQKAHRSSGSGFSSPVFQQQLKAAAEKAEVRNAQQDSSSQNSSRASSDVSDDDDSEDEDRTGQKSNQASPGNASRSNSSSPSVKDELRRMRNSLLGKSDRTRAAVQAAKEAASQLENEPSTSALTEQTTPEANGSGSSAEEGDEAEMAKSVASWQAEEANRIAADVPLVGVANPPTQNQSSNSEDGTSPQGSPNKTALTQIDRSDDGGSDTAVTPGTGAYNKQMRLLNQGLELSSDDELASIPIPMHMDSEGDSDRFATDPAFADMQDHSDTDRSDHDHSDDDILPVATIFVPDSDVDTTPDVKGIQDDVAKTIAAVEAIRSAKLEARAQSAAQTQQLLDAMAKVREENDSKELQSEIAEVCIRLQRRWAHHY